MSHKLLYLICYDITNDRLRARIAAVLEEHGTRVQGSVFELWLSHGQARRLGDRLGNMLESGDSLRLYPLSRGALRNAQHFGRGGPPDPGDFLLF